MTIELPHRYNPRPYQIPAWRTMDECKRVLLVWHRRAGKDKLCLNKLVARAAETKANFAYYMPTAALGRKALWQNVDVTNGMRVIDHIPKELLAKPPNQTDMRIELINGSTIQILGTDNLDVVGGNYYGVVFSEYQNQNPLAWDYTRPILAENGGFAWFNGTPRGENHFHDMLKMAKNNDAWFAQVLTCDDTQAITAEQIDEERKSGMSEALIRQEFYCDFSVSNENAIYGREMSKALAEDRIGEFPVDGRSPVHTFWDLGGPRNTVVWYGQRLAFGRWRWIDCDIGLDLTIVERFAHMSAKGYSYGRHYLPHDARQTQRNGVTFEADAAAAGFRSMVVVPVIPDYWQGIGYVRELMPSFEWRLPACETGVKGIKAYEMASDSSSGIVRNVPLHTWASHVCLRAGSLVDTLRGPIPIQFVTSMDLVRTPTGFLRVIASGSMRESSTFTRLKFSNGAILECTNDHKIYLNGQLTRADASRTMDLAWTPQTSPNLSFLRRSNTSFRDAITSPLQVLAKSTVIFIAQYGRQLMGKFQTGLMSITETAIAMITELKTWRQWTVPSIIACTAKQIRGSLAEPQQKSCLKGQFLRPVHGTQRLMGKDGTASMPRNLLQNASHSPETASSVRLSISQKHITQFFAQVNAKASHVAPPRQAQCRSYVRTAASLLRIIAERIAPKLVRADAIKIRLISCETFETENCEPVYDLTIEVDHCYYANGILVSNCDGVRTMAEAERLGLIHSGSGQSTSTRRRSDVQDTN